MSRSESATAITAGLSTPHSTRSSSPRHPISFRLRSFISCGRAAGAFSRRKKREREGANERDSARALLATGGGARVRPGQSHMSKPYPKPRPRSGATLVVLVGAGFKPDLVRHSQFVRLIRA